MAEDGYIGELSDVLEALGEQLREANKKVGNKSDGPVIGLHSATITLETTVRREANGGLKLWVIDAGASSQASKTIKVEVHANAFDPADLPIGQ